MTALGYIVSHPGQVSAGAGIGLVVFLVAVRLLTEIRVRRNGGVRAPIIASNPFTGMHAGGISPEHVLD